jgi:hypothetical protein
MPKLAPYSRKSGSNGEDEKLSLDEQLSRLRRTVDFDTFDISIQQLIGMAERKEIDIAPAFQRQFRWDHVRCSQLIESFFLGIPVPSLFMAANENDSTWELVDGLQRLSTLIKFAGPPQVRDRLKLGEALHLQGLEKLTSFEGKTFETLPKTLRLHFELRPVKVVTLSDKSDKAVRFDLFERLNTGGIALSAQEVRDCVYRGAFSQLLETLARDQNFKKVVRLNSKQEMDGTREECVLRFFAFFDRYLDFEHSVKSFLNTYMEDAAKQFRADRGEKLFKATFLQLANALPEGISRLKGKKTTPLNLFEGVAVGAALVIDKGDKIKGDIKTWIGSDDLLQYTTQSTNDRKNVRGRIEVCRDRFRGK